eukprot:COSAG02_NODE_2209_length_9497_cov_60.725474_4_plen_83_part_00
MTTATKHQNWNSLIFVWTSDYDYKALAQALDFFVVMDYDSNDAHDAIPGDSKPPCPTCFFANAALPVVKKGKQTKLCRLSTR